MYIFSQIRYQQITKLIHIIAKYYVEDLSHLLIEKDSNAYEILVTSNNIENDKNLNNEKFGEGNANSDIKTEIITENVEILNDNSKTEKSISKYQKSDINLNEQINKPWATYEDFRKPNFRKLITVKTIIYPVFILIFIMILMSSTFVFTNRHADFFNQNSRLIKLLSLTNADIFIVNTAVRDYVHSGSNTSMSTLDFYDKERDQFIYNTYKLYNELETSSGVGLSDLNKYLSSVIDSTSRFKNSLSPEFSRSSTHLNFLSNKDLKTLVVDFINSLDEIVYSYQNPSISTPKYNNGLNQIIADLTYVIDKELEILNEKVNSNLRNVNRIFNIFYILVIIVLSIMTIYFAYYTVFKLQKNLSHELYASKNILNIVKSSLIHGSAKLLTFIHIHLVHELNED